MRTILLILLTATTATLYAQPNFSAVVTAIKAGNTMEISNYMDANVEVTVEDNDGSYDKGQAISVISSFFQKNAPNSCSLVHSGSARDGASYYCIGNLSAGGNKYRVYIFFKKVGGNYLIQEMRFEEE
ncbi:DUF4783 domain-containing protein [Aureispira anguillae]|uniref:DUF4783 domain-containing protein n=1 Tax=Aureispira anguillae TaxID=2864201 RepID=A0A915YES6_9BACT|nr:DUF4783 domain-containing protein [Aureispira anguillae]BDS11789.1 DUF4783 domain-containing protein [Aureispira anguillae]